MNSFRARFSKRLNLLLLLSLAILLVGQSSSKAFADYTCPPGITDLDCQAIVNNWVNWIPGGAICSEESTTLPAALSTTGAPAYIPTPPTGTDHEHQIYNFFTLQVGLSPIATAGIMGNMQAESGLDPTAEQAPGSWSDMSNEYLHAVGLVQWDGGRRPAFINYAQSHSTDPQGMLVQLNYVWNELNTSHKDALTAMEKETDAGQAAYDFHKYYEVSADSQAAIQKNRMDVAVKFLSDLSGAAAGAGGCAGANSSSPECGTATGNQRIVCDAEQYDTVSYYEGLKGGHQGAAKWHAECKATYSGGAPTTTTLGYPIGPNCFLDCSGLVNIAVYDIFKVELDENTDGERADIGKYWKELSFSQVRPGDIMQPFPGHVEIVDHVQGTTLYTFAAHTDNRPQPDQVGPAKYRYSSKQRYFHYIGPGSDVQVAT